MRVSIGIPFYNSEATLLDSIRSVYAQTHTDWELILVDDGSKDKSLEIARAVERADPRVRVVSDGQNLKLPGRLNQLAQIASNEILVRMDSDDIAHPDRIAKQLAYMTANPKVDVVGSQVFTFDEHNVITGVQRRKLQDTPYKIVKNHFLIHPSVMYKAEWVRQNPYDGDYIRAEDLELWCRTAGKTEFAIMDEYLLFLRKITVSRIQDYIRSNTTDLKIIDTYKGTMTPAQYSELKRKYLLKRYVHLAAHRLGVYYMLVKAKVKEIDPALKAQGEEALKRVLQTPVPGHPNL
ncbi:glycosyltransferase [soil metagenome]